MVVNRISGVFFFVLMTIATSVYATHENDHRYKIFGYVHGDNGQPVNDAKVLIVVSRIDEGTTVFTDSEGYYETVLHLHDNNLGDEVVVTANNVSRTGIIEFVPGDKNSERGLEVSFGKKAEETGGSGEMNPNYIIIGVVGIIVSGSVFYFSKSRKSKQHPKNR